MKQLITISLTAITALMISSCDVINPAEDIPAYLHIEPFDFVIGAGQGTGSQRITDGWVYVNGEYLGAYTLPATLPVIASGASDIIVDPGVKDNGIAATPDIYPFFKRFEINVDLSPEEVDTIHPTTTYLSTAAFQFIEGFETDQHFFKADLDNNVNTNIDLVTSNVFEGGSSGRIKLDLDNPFAEIGSIALQEYPPSGTAVYIELNYKADVPLGLGWVSYDRFGIRSGRVIDRGVNSNDDWNKVYFNFTEIIREFQLSDAASFQLVLQAGIPIENGEFTMDNAEVLLDNIKMVQFQQ